MQSDLTVGYQNDITLGGAVQTVAEDVHRIAEQGSRMGLVLNVSKCELIANSKMVVADPLLASFSLLGTQCFLARHFLVNSMR